MSLQFMIPPFDEENDIIPIAGGEDENEEWTFEEGELPLLALRNTVVFPGVVLPITIGRDASVKAVQAANKQDGLIMVVAQTDPEVEHPERDELHDLGTVARIMKVLKMPDGSTTCILQGKRKAEVTSITAEHPFMKVSVFVVNEEYPEKDAEFIAKMDTMKELGREIIERSNQIPTEAKAVLDNIKNDFFLINFVATNLSTTVEAKQKLLRINDLGIRANKVLEMMQRELQMLKLKDKIQSKTQHDIEKQQRDYFLHQQMKTIQEELGADSPHKDVERLEQRAKEMDLPKAVSEVLDKELRRLRRTNPASAEYPITINYAELILDLPWSTYTEDKLDLRRAKKILDKEHYGLTKIKERILEHLAVLKMKGDLKSPILCLAGPPGVGKTSLGKSIAKAMGRKYVRMSLGGLRDESEIRGHRRTYIGAMPGRIIQHLKKVKTSNPVFVLDEIDKVGSDFRGDPSSALLEVLDPEQNNAFYDNYLELDYDLSNVLFLATANNLASIQPALRDRMEIIRIEGYAVEEKIEIAVRHLVPNQREVHGLTGKQVRFSRSVLQFIIEKYTRESGVRSLERKIAGVMRSIAKAISLGEEYNVSVKKEDVEEYLGKPVFDAERFIKGNPPGVAVGLAYTSVGGDILFMEATHYKGKEGLTLTGNLGDVMKESARTALTYLRAHADKWNIDDEDFEKKTIHIHVPEGATPKDGPSAGVTLLTTLASLFTGRKVKERLAMTGEITLRGKVLPVGGIKEKILAARRSGITEIILCKANEKDVVEIEGDFIEGLTFHYVEDMDEVLDIALM